MKNVAELMAQQPNGPPKMPAQSLSEPGLDDPEEAKAEGGNALDDILAGLEDDLLDLEPPEAYGAAK